MKYPYFITVGLRFNGWNTLKMSETKTWLLATLRMTALLSKQTGSPPVRVSYLVNLRRFDQHFFYCKGKTEIVYLFVSCFQSFNLNIHTTVLVGISIIVHAFFKIGNVRGSVSDFVGVTIEAA